MLMLLKRAVGEEGRKLRKDKSINKKWIIIQFLNVLSIFLNVLYSFGKVIYPILYGVGVYKGTSAP